MAMNTWALDRRPARPAQGHVQSARWFSMVSACRGVESWSRGGVHAKGTIRAIEIRQHVDLRGTRVLMIDGPAVSLGARSKGT